MKKEGILPQIPEIEDPDMKRFYTEIVEELERLRSEASDSIHTKVKHINADYTINANDPYTEYVVDNSGANIEVTFCPLAPIKFKIIALSGDYNVTCTPLDVTVNGYATSPLINQEKGWWEFSGDMDSDIWVGTTNGYSTIYEVSSETADTGLALDGTWDDVTGMTLLNGIYGKGYLEAYGVQNVIDSSAPQQITMAWGIGKTAGNNSPDICGGTVNDIRIYLASANTHYQQIFPRIISRFKYESDSSIIYMKAKATSDEMNITTHAISGDTDCPMYIKWYRTA